MPYHNDPEAIQWLHDYWDYVQMIERGREPPLDSEDIGGWDGLAQAFTDSQIHQQVLDYLAFDEDNGLTDRLNMLYSKYGNVKKMKKSVKDRIDSEYGTNTYDTLRMAMFGDEELSTWSEEELNDPDSFIEWAIEEGGIPKTMRSELMDVFNEEYGRFKASTKKKVKKAGSFESYNNDAEILNSMEPDVEYTLEEIIEKNPHISEQEINYSLKRLNELPWKADQFNLYRISEGRYVKTDRYLASTKKSQDIQEFMQNLSEDIESVVRGYANGDSDIINVNSSSANNKVDIEVIYQPFDCLSRNGEVKSFVYQVHISGNPSFLRLKEAYFIQGELYYRIPDTIKFEQDIFREVSDKEFYIYGKYDYPDGYGIYEGFDAEVGKMLSSIDMALRDCSRRYNMLKELARESLIDYYGDYYTASTKKSQDIHSMIADIRKNNNSLKKNRVRL